MEQVTIPRQISTTAIKRTPSSQLTKLKFSPNRNEVQTKVKTVVTPAKVISETQQGTIDIIIVSAIPLTYHFSAWNLRLSSRENG